MRHILLALMLTLSGTLIANAHTEGDTKAKIREDTNAEYDELILKCGLEIDAVTDFNHKTEFWRICNLDDGNQIIKIESYKEDTYFQEVYFKKSENLVYAMEAEYYIPKNHFI